MSTPPQRRVAMTLLAHPDDAEILCAGTLIRLADAGWEIHIATVAAGDCGSTSLDREEISRVRHREGTNAAATINAAYHCLNEADVHVCFCERAIQKTIDLFRCIAPTLVFTHPRLDYMLDHEQVHLLARSASFAYPIPNATDTPLRPGSAIPWLYYCDPVDGANPYTHEIVAPSTLIDTTNQMARKIEMLSCHVSQREWLRAHHEIDDYIESMRRHNAMRGQAAHVEYAEAFVQHRGHPYPKTDLLQILFA